MIEKKRVPGTADESRFVETMRRVREIQGLSQGDLAARLADAGWEGFRQTTISRIEKGERTVRLAEAHAIAQVLGMSLSRMMDEASQDEKNDYSRRISELDGVMVDLERQIAGHRQKLGSAERMLALCQTEKQRLTAAYASGEEGVESMMPSLYREYYSELMREQNILGAEADPDGVGYEAR